LDLSWGFLLSFRERRKSNVGGRTGRLKGGVNGSISAAGRQQNTEWNSDGKTREAEISRISRAEKSVRFFTDIEHSILPASAEIIHFNGHYDVLSFSEITESRLSRPIICSELSYLHSRMISRESESQTRSLEFRIDA